jgi:ComF family protein
MPLPAVPRPDVQAGSAANALLSGMVVLLQIFMGISQALSPVVDLVFPPRCALCGGSIATQAGLCGDCWGGLVIPATPACDLCQRPFVGAVPEGLVCAPCMAEPPLHDGIAAATVYNAASRKLVLSLKYGRRIALAPLLARMMRTRLVTVADLDASWLVVPVPLHRWRLWQRSFNQSALLAREIARATGARLAVDALVRHKHTPTLGGLGRDARARMLAGTMRLHPRRKWKWQGAQVLLVDDVLTSGATTNACIAVLKRAGASRVVIACAARVMDETLPHI